MKQLEIQGERMPGLGLGTWQLHGGECRQAVLRALAVGYRHIDTAESYDNEEEVGRAIRESSVERDDIFLTTKVWFDHLERDALLRAVAASLRRLDTDYVDLLLIHWPNPDAPLRETLGTMLELKAAHKVRHIGVSNFPPTLVEAALDLTQIFCNQVECHPYLAQEPLRELATRHDHVLTAYSPLARGRVMEDETLLEIGDEHGKTPAQVTLRWHMQRDHVAAVPRSGRAEHLESNFDVFDFDLSHEEMNRISSLSRGERLIDPSFSPAWEAASRGRG